jgi:hypothetical protein
VDVFVHDLDEAIADIERALLTRLGALQLAGGGGCGWPLTGVRSQRMHDGL